MKDIAFEDFEDYLQNKLNKEDREGFVKRLKEDTAFADSFSIYMEIEAQMQMSLANESKEEAFVSVFTKLNNKYFNQGYAKPPPPNFI